MNWLELIRRYQELQPAIQQGAEIAKQLAANVAAARAQAEASGDAEAIGIIDAIVADVDRRLAAHRSEGVS